MIIKTKTNKQTSPKQTKKPKPRIKDITDKEKKCSLYKNS